MDDLILILGDLKEIIASVIVIVITTINQIKAKKRGVDISTKIDDNDKKQDERIKTIEQKQDLQTEQFNKMFKYLANNDLAQNIKSKVNNTISNKITAYNIDNDELKSYFFAGGDAIAYLIDKLIVADFFNKENKFNVQEFQLIAKYKLKNIKTRMQINKLGVDCSFAEDLKAHIYINISELSSKLQDIKTGRYNGTSKIEFEKAFINCASNIVSDTIEFYNDYLKNIKESA